MTAYLDLADYLLIAGRVLGPPAEAIARCIGMMPRSSDRPWGGRTVAVQMSRGAEHMPAISMYVAAPATSLCERRAYNARIEICALLSVNVRP